MSKELITKEEFGVMQGLAKTFLGSGLFKDTQSEAAAIVKMMAGKELNMGPFEAMRNLNVIQGQVTLTSGCIAARIKGSGKYDYSIERMEDDGCILQFSQNGKFVGASKFDKADATAAGLLSREIWKKYPRNMMFARALTNGARWYCAEVFGGPIYTSEEISKNEPVDAEWEPQTKNLNHGGTHKAVRDILPEKMSPNEIPLSQRDDYEQHVSPGPIVADENPHFYVIEGLQGCDPEVAGKAIAEIPVKKLEASLKPKFAAFTTDRDKVNIAAYLKSLEEQTRKQPTAKEKIEAEREKLSQEPLPDFSSDINF